MFDFSVFISYSGTRAEANRLARRLRAAGLRATVSESFANPGRDLREKILRHLDISDVVYVLWDDSAIKSFWVNQEVGYALKAGIPVVPVTKGEVRKMGLLDRTEVIRFASEAKAFGAIIRDAKRRASTGLRSSYASYSDLSPATWKERVTKDTQKALRTRGWKKLDLRSHFERSLFDYEPPTYAKLIGGTKYVISPEWDDGVRIRHPRHSFERTFPRLKRTHRKFGTRILPWSIRRHRKTLPTPRQGWPYTLVQITDHSFFMGPGRGYEFSPAEERQCPARFESQRFDDAGILRELAAIETWIKESYRLLERSYRRLSAVEPQRD